MAADSAGRLRSILNWLKRVKRVDLPGVESLGGVELSENPSEFIDAKFINAVIKLENLAKKIIEHHEVTALIDRIDDVWDGSESSKEFIVGALKAMRFINLLPRKSKTSTVILFLRTDLWQEVVFNDRNKISQDIEILDWTEDDLIRVVEARINSSLDRNDITWNDVFFSGEMRQRAKSKTYVLKRTMLRPRDILAFSTFAIEESIRNGNDIVTAEDIYRCENRYSKHILDELEDEMEGSINDLQAYLASFRAIGKRNFKSDTWIAENEKRNIDKSESSNILKKFFEASVVGVFEAGGAGGGSRSLYRYQDRFLQPHENSLMQVHLAIAKQLGLKDS